uniref:Antifreeze protein type IV n=2 Tax=Sander lucioperca TaxID=283035 RepID=A0A8C9YIJ4_SANLU
MKIQHVRHDVCVCTTAAAERRNQRAYAKRGNRLADVARLGKSLSCSSAAMKFSLVAALVVVLAVAYGTEAGSVVKRDAQTDLEKLTQLINDMSASITSATQDMVEKVKALEVTNTAQTYIEESRAQIQPLVDKVQAEAAKLQEQVKPYIANIEDQIKPLTDNFQAQVQPLTDNFQAQVQPLTDMMEKFFQQVMDQTKALLPPQ